MPSTSVYAVAQSEPPQWRPGEEAAASAFVGISLFLVLENLFGIIRLFRKRQGLYFWSMLAGTCGCLLDCLGIILKYLAPHKNIWVFYALCLLIGWSTYCLAQLLVLYSRLHLVNQNPKVQRFVFVITLSTLLTVTVPTWIVVLPAYNVDPKISSVWSPRDAIVERYNQIVYTIVELIISGIYILSLVRLLHLKSSVRQRRVMFDLIYVNIINVAFDIICVVLVYLNQLGLSHPIQTFSYALKLRLEFIVLNQLMSVAARGLNRETFGEKRYHHASQPDTFSTELRRFGVRDPPPSEQKSEAKKVASRDDPSKDSIQISMPWPVLPRGHHPSASATSERTLSKSEKNLPTPPLEDEISEEASHAPPESPILQPDDPHPNFRRIRAALQSVRPGSRRDPDGSESRPISGHWGNSAQRRSRHGPQDDDDDEEEIGFHMWENRGRVVLEVPWFKTSARHV